ncbi:FecR family protein [Chitinophaga solisilvae]|uniref:FecR family protein n=1 Tax=Chitinophaga solisilvae TaxID=1233460 RepID=UPI00136D96C3|nr:FecR domain-containing protein [Chitinophaga solisilvae]
MENGNINNDQLLALLEKYSRHECTESELQWIRQWYEQLDVSGQQPHAQPGTPAAAALKAQGWETVLDAARVRRKPVYLRTWFRAAAAVLLIGGCSLLVWLRYQPAANIIQAGSAIVQQQLPDGTRIWLNRKSRLTCYPNDNRTVSLEGEAFFDVAQNAAKPFVIHTSRMDIRVLGTSFNVKAYTEDISSETLLVTGAVEITLKNNQQKLRLRPNEKIVLKSANTGSYQIKTNTVNNDSTYNDILWRDNKLVFNHETFEEIAAKMERWYGVRIHIQDASLKNLLFTAIFEQETIDQTLTALQLSAPFHYQINQHDIFITK